MVKPVSVDEAYNLWILLAQARRAILNARSVELKPYRISYRQAAVLFTVGSMNEKITPTELSRRLFLAPHTVSATLKLMKMRGLVKLTKDLERKNLVRVSMTKKGREAYDKSRSRESIYNIMTVLTQEEHKRLKSVLLKLTEKALDEAGRGQKLAPALVSSFAK